VVEMVDILFCSNRRPFDISTEKFASLIYSLFPHINLPLIVYYSPWWTLESHTFTEFARYELAKLWNFGFLEYYENTDHFDSKCEGQNPDWTI